MAAGDVAFLTEDEILELHEMALDQHGGVAGHRSELVSAVAEYPRNKCGYLDAFPSIPALAGYYAFAAAKFHPFADGNKRVAAAILEVFLLKNGMELIADDDDAYVAIEDLAAGNIGEEDIAAWVSENSVPID